MVQLRAIDDEIEISLAHEEFDARAERAASGALWARQARGRLAPPVLSDSRKLNDELSDSGPALYHYGIEPVATPEDPHPAKTTPAEALRKRPRFEPKVPPRPRRWGVT